MVTPMWSVYGEKTRGYTHEKKNMPCQDAFAYRNGNEYIVAAVADGHGSPSCPYSAEGAKAAVEIAIDILEDAVRLGGGLAEMKRNMDMYIPKKIDYLWKTKINGIHREKCGDEGDIHILYGTTLLCLAMTEEYCCALQLGDGDILSVSESGETEWLIEPKPLAGSETESLCRKESWRDMRVNLFPAVKNHGMYLLATDGYNNSYAEESEFLQLGRDYLEKARTDGFESVKVSLGGWISDTSRGGSGDDITLVIIYKEADS